MNIEERVRTLQSKINRLMALLALTVMAGVVVVTYYSGAPQAEAYGNQAPKTVKAQKFVVTNGAGRDIAAFGNVDGNTGLMIKHRSANIIIGAMDDGTGMYIYDSKGNVRIGSAYLPGKDQAMMAIGDGSGNMQWIAPN